MCCFFADEPFAFLWISYWTFKITIHFITWNHNVCHIIFNNILQENQIMLFLSNIALVSTRAKTTDHDFEEVQLLRTYLCLMFTNLKYFNIKWCSNVEVTSFRIEKLHTDEERSWTFLWPLTFSLNLSWTFLSWTLTIGLSFSMRSFTVVL